MKTRCILTVSLLLCSRVFGLDPFNPPEQWEAYQQRILKDREHEKPVWERPKPGTSPSVAIQTLILPEFAVENASVQKAFDAWQDACRKGGVNVQVYLEPAALINELTIAHAAKGETAAKTLSYLENLSLSHVRLVNDVFLAGIHSDLDPHAVMFRCWVLSAPVQELLGLNQPQRSADDKWMAVEGRLKALGAAFPQGTYADYHSELRALVVINTHVTLAAIAELITEAEGQALVRQFQGKGLVEMDGYRLEVRSLPLKKEHAAKIGARLRDDQGRLLPFGVSTARWAESRGLVIPSGGGVWLDRDSSTLWIRSRPDALDEFAQKVREVQ